MADILIVKCRIPISRQQMKAILNYLKEQKETGVVLLPHYLEAQMIPDDIEIKLVDKNGKENIDGNGKEMR